MLAKLTSKNQLTLPKAVVSAVGVTDYFDVQIVAGQIVLTPVRIQRGDAVRSKLQALGLTTADMADAVTWARDGQSRLQARQSAVAEESTSYPATTPRRGKGTRSKASKE